MSITGILKNTPIWAVKSDQAISSDGSIGLPSLRFKNATARGVSMSSSMLSFHVLP